MQLPTCTHILREGDREKINRNGKETKRERERERGRKRRKKYDESGDKSI